MKSHTNTGSIEEEIENAGLIIKQFRYWPDFHDAEIISLKFDRNFEGRNPTIYMELYAFEMTGQLKGRHYKQIKHCLIEFAFFEIGINEIDGFNHQNAIDSLKFNKEEGFLSCEINGAYGVDGIITAKRIRVNTLKSISK